MANIVFDFLHNYETGERRESEPANAYQYDEGHVLEAILPSVVTTVELHYWIRGMEEAEAYTPASITPNTDGSCTILGNIPNKYFETNGELRVYIVVTDGDASITTYEGKLHICQRSMPDDYVDDDPENEATRVLTEAQAAATTATQQAQAASASAGQAQQSAQTLSQSVEQIATNTQDISTLKEDYSDILNSAYVTDTASGAIASFLDGADNVPVKSLTVNIEPVQEGSGDPSPDNVRPISGHSTAVVTRTGKNLIVYPFDNTESRTINGVTFTPNSDGTITANGTASSNAVYTIHASMPIPDGTYILSGGKSGYKFVGLGYLNSDTTTTETRVNDFATSVVTFTPHKGRITYLQLVISSGQTLTNEVFYPMIRLASDTDATFAPYTAQTVTIDLGGTRYGGTLDATTGVLTVTKGYVKLSDLTDWGSLSSLDRGVMRHILTNAVAPPNTVPTTAIMSNRKAKGHGPITASDIDSFAISPAAVVTIPMGRAITTAEFLAECGNDQLCYPLATPQTVQLTAEEVITLLGQNNIWNDCGDTEVEYRADTKLYIEKLTAPTEDDMIADHAISANSFFMVGNSLYRATTAIASGATITVGTNATKLSLSDALNALA